MSLKGLSILSWTLPQRTPRTLASGRNTRTDSVQHQRRCLFCRGLTSFFYFILFFASWIWNVRFSYFVMNVWCWRERSTILQSKEDFITHVFSAFICYDTWPLSIVTLLPLTFLALFSKCLFYDDQCSIERSDARLLPRNVIMTRNCKNEWMLQTHFTMCWFSKKTEQGVISTSQCLGTTCSSESGKSFWCNLYKIKYRESEKTHKILIICYHFKF